MKARDDHPRSWLGSLFARAKIRLHLVTSLRTILSCVAYAFHAIDSRFPANRVTDDNDDVPFLHDAMSERPVPPPDRPNAASADYRLAERQVQLGGSAVQLPGLFAGQRRDTSLN